MTFYQVDNVTGVPRIKLRIGGGAAVQPDVAGLHHRHRDGVQTPVRQRRASGAQRRQPDLPSRRATNWNSTAAPSRTPLAWMRGSATTPQANDDGHKVDLSASRTTAFADRRHEQPHCIRTKAVT